jgi:hypothetical protein
MIVYPAATNRDAVNHAAMPQHQLYCPLLAVSLVCNTCSFCCCSTGSWLQQHKKWAHSTRHCNNYVGHRYAHTLSATEENITDLEVTFRFLVPRPVTRDTLTAPFVFVFRVVTHRMYCSLPRLILLKPALVSPFMSRGAPHQPA